MKGKKRKSSLSSYGTSNAPAIDLGADECPGWIFSVANNEWEKFDKLSEKPINEDSYFVGKGFAIYVPKRLVQGGATVIVRK